MSERLVEITWHDAWSQNKGWHSAEELPEAVPIVIQSVGWIIKESADGVMLAGSRGDNGTYNGVVFRPHGMIKKIKDIK